MLADQSGFRGIGSVALDVLASGTEMLRSKSLTVIPLTPV